MATKRPQSKPASKTATAKSKPSKPQSPSRPPARVLKHPGPKAAPASTAAAPKSPKPVPTQQPLDLAPAAGISTDLLNRAAIAAWRILAHDASPDDAVAEVAALAPADVAPMVLMAAADMTPDMVALAADMRDALMDEIARAVEPEAAPANPGPPSEWKPLWSDPDSKEAKEAAMLVRIIASNSIQEKQLAAERKKAKDALLLVFRSRKMTHAMVAGRPMFIYRGNSGGGLDAHLLLKAGCTADQIAAGRKPDSYNYDVRFADTPHRSQRPAGPEDGGQ